MGSKLRFEKTEFGLVGFGGGHDAGLAKEGGGPEEVDRCDVAMSPSMPFA